MYIRFVSSHQHPIANANLGMFCAREEIDFSQLQDSDQRAQEEAFFWFSSRGPGRLLYPRLKGRSQTRNVRQSLFWFKEKAAFFGPDKGSVIKRARELAKVLSEAGTEIREIKMEDPGEIIWQDHKQILALPKTDQSYYAFPIEETSETPEE